MNILIDTNIFIPLETKNISEIEPETHLINEFYRKAKELEYHIFLLDQQVKDLENDKDFERKNARLLAFEKYEILKNVKINQQVQEIFSNIKPKSHDEIDIALLNVVYANAVSLLITNDEGVHKKAKKLGIEEKIYNLEEALNFVNAHLVKTLKIDSKHPIINSDKCCNLDINDTFFDSLRNDYSNFNNWFKEKCQKEHRDCLIIRNENMIEGLCIYKFEEPIYGMHGKILKICTFKLCSSGKKLGELLLKILFQYCYNSSIDYLYVTAYEKNYICNFFRNFGFYEYHKRKEDSGELTFIKGMKPPNSCCENVLDFNIKYGTKYYDINQNAFLIPIIYNYHAMLFPETETTLFPELDYAHSYSNAIRKAYISKSNSNLLRAGDILFFYKTHSEGTIKTCGVIEKVCRSDNVDEILAITGQRTIYQYDDIEKMCMKERSLLILLFRQTESLIKEIKLNDLIKLKLIKGVPQTITKLSEEAKKCILRQKPF